MSSHERLLKQWEFQFFLGMNTRRQELEGGIGSYNLSNKSYRNIHMEDEGQTVEKVYFDPKNLKIKFEGVK